MDEKNTVTGTIIGELILGELPSWHRGVCRAEYVDGKIVVYGENDHPCGEIDVEKYRDKPSVLGENNLVLDLGKIADEANQIIEDEHDAL